MAHTDSGRYRKNMVYPETMMLRVLLICLGCLLAVPFARPAHAQFLPSIGMGASTATESNHEICTSPCNLQTLTVNTTSTVYVMLFDSATLPTGAGVTPFMSVQLQANTQQQFGGSPAVKITKALWVACSSTGPFTNTLSSACNFSWQTQ